MNDAIENVCVKNNNMTLRGRRARARLPCCDRDDGGKGPIPARVPGGFVVDMLEEKGPMDRGEAGLVLSWLGFVEREAEEADLLVGIGRLRGAVMKAATAGEGLRGL